MKSTTDLNMVNAYIPGRASLAPSTAAMIERRDALLGKDLDQRRDFVWGVDGLVEQRKSRQHGAFSDCPAMTLICPDMTLPKRC